VRVASLHRYPVKSLRGTDVPAIDVEPAGPVGDRRWMVLDAAGDTLTARDHHRMLGVRATSAPDGTLTLTAGGRPDLVVPEPVDGELVPVTLSRLDVARAAGPAADAWLSAAVDRPVRLVWQDDPARRSVSQAHGGRPGEPLSLADAGPLLVTTTASMRALNAWIAERELESHAQRPVAATTGAAPDLPPPLGMERFRPNLVVDGDLDPFVEDGWAGLRVGGVELRFGEVCDRCVLTTVDPDTLAKGKEPVRTLARHRSWDGRVWFGVRMVPVTTGRVGVGDAVVPL
jgi:uncharacterized protein YcbX